MRNLLDYIFKARNDADIVSKGSIIKEIEGDYMNMLEKIKFEGELKGKLEGKLEQAIETARKMREKGFSISEILEITGLTEEQLNENGIG